MIFDTHAHYTDEAFNADRDELIKKLPPLVELVMNNSCDGESSLQAIALAEKYPLMYAAVGWHPENAESFSDASPDLLRAWAKHPKVRAIGEIGLDYHYDDPPRDVQKRVFSRQLELAGELALPVVVHDRDAHEDCMELVRRFPRVRGEFHCYSGSAEMAKEILDRGWYLGFTGVITFKNARKAIEVLQMCPMDRILIETDCPYLAPAPHRGERNDSRYLVYVAEKIAELKGVTRERAIELTNENGRRFFGF